ncbi:MAG TPA: hypothetical protein VFC85_06940, partial [Verrucomicrobiae bacterium]|nr:hypothetical protein [Verrucomicrobiae bacterium]
MNEASANPLAPPLAGAKPPGEGWTLKRWLAVITIIFAAHVLLIFCFGERKKIVPRPVANVPTLQFAGKPDELLALENPALFALPNPKDFASAVWLKMPDISPPFFGWTEPPRWLTLAPENLGATFHSFMQTNYFAGYSFQFKPPPKFTEPPLPAPLALPQNSTMRVTGALAKRKLLQQLNPPSLPY